MTIRPASTERLAAYLEAHRPVIDAALDGYLPPPEGPIARLAEAMRYSVFAGGKRLRPMLVLLASDLCGGQQAHAVPPACALELVHTYSLIHDDLPAMDDDDFRRGRPSCHKAFGEAAAVLAGDALLTLAFAIVAQPPVAHLAAPLVTELAHAAGHGGMLGGQIADVEAEGTGPSAETVDFIHHHKTAALIAACLRLGAIAAGADEATLARLGRFGRHVGLAFQIADDALDVEASSKQLGKTAGKDATQGKVTYPAVYGLEETHRRAAALIGQALDELAPFGPSADLLRDVAHYVVSRNT
ncbi:MAG: polyprenyl synthetase family protein [Candidatus Brocadiae bacterium]|nr:polyprenyl synthetase family protein [Candidatus Brocadiia bacterium]